MSNQSVAVVTGAASGIGRSTAEVLAAAGWALTLVDRNTDALHSVAAALPSRSHPHAAGADVASVADVEAVVSQTIDRFGKIDGLVNAAGVTVIDDTLVESVPDDVFDRILEVNLRGVFLMCKNVLPWMRRNGAGAIVNIASAAALVGSGGPAYTASKGGVVALTRVVARQYATELIRCNVICPGPVDTPMIAITQSKPGRGPWSPPPGTIPRMGRPSDVAHLAEYLLSERASWITGATYAVDGGMTGH